MDVVSKLVVLQVYIHWLKGIEINVDTTNINVQLLDKMYTIADKNLREYGLHPFSSNSFVYNFNF